VHPHSVKRDLRLVGPPSRDHLKKLSISCRPQIEVPTVTEIKSSHRMPQSMPYVDNSEPMLQRRRVNIPHPLDPEVHATSRTSKLGIAMAPTPPIRARMRVT